MVLVVLFPLPDEKNVDVKTIFTCCSQTCLLEMKPRVLSMHLVETQIAPAAGTGYQNKGHSTIRRTRQCAPVENPVPGQAGAAQHRVASPMPQQHSPGYKQGVQGVPAGQHMPFSHSTTWPHRLMATAVGRCPCNAD